MPEPLDFGSLVDAFERMEDKPREEYRRSAFGWPGGKYRSLEQILPRLRKSDKWIEVCGGSGVITLNRQSCALEVFNDRHSGVTAFFRCIQDSSKNQRLVERLRYMVHSREEFIWCAATWENPTDDVERAARWYYMVRTSFGQLGRNWARATSGISQIGPKLRRGLNLFPALYQRFRDVQIENMDACQCIRDYDSEDATFYVDPDYIGTDPGIYQHQVEHKHLLDTIFCSKGFFAVSNYANPLYDGYDWDAVYAWPAHVSIKSQAFHDSNHLKGKEEFMGREIKAEETLYIREAR
jgi:DNA adenine methylase